LPLAEIRPAVEANKQGLRKAHRYLPLFFQLDQEEFQSLIAHIFRQVHLGRSPDRFPGLAAALLSFSIWQSEFAVEVCQTNQHAGWMPMHLGFFMRVVGNPQNTDSVVFDLHFVVLGIDCHGIRMGFALCFGVR